MSLNLEELENQIHKAFASALASAAKAQADAEARAKAEAKARADALSKDQIHKAFLLWRHFQEENISLKQPGLIYVEGLQKALSHIALYEPLQKIFEIGSEYGFSKSEVGNILLIHGAYFRLIKEGLLSRAQSRFIDSLYQPGFPSLEYNTQNQDILAPWITLPAQEALLDLELDRFTVIEYGSGISTFFFAFESKKCFSFEDDNDPHGGISWIARMQKQANNINQPINLISPDKINVKPSYIIQNYCYDEGPILVSIDGLDRENHFSEWSQYISQNKDKLILLLIDNTDIGFESQFLLLADHGASIVHHYGFTYGQFEPNKGCTSFCTLHPQLLIGKNPSPKFHDRRWGGMR